MLYIPIDANLIRCSSYVNFICLHQSRVKERKKDMQSIHSGAFRVLDYLLKKR